MDKFTTDELEFHFELEKINISGRGTRNIEKGEIAWNVFVCGR